MIHATWTTPYKGEVKTLHLRRDPFRHGLGHYTDVDGVLWDIYAMRGSTYLKDGKAYVNARRVANHSGYYSTAAGSGGSNSINRWSPFYVEVV